jgi:site-specific recombinase XerD
MLARPEPRVSPQARASRCQQKYGVQRALYSFRNRCNADQPGRKLAQLALAHRMLNAGAKMTEIQGILGRESISTTSSIYSHCDVKNLGAAYDRYSGTLEEMA